MKNYGVKIWEMIKIQKNYSEIWNVLFDSRWTFVDFMRGRRYAQKLMELLITELIKALKIWVICQPRFDQVNQLSHFKWGSWKNSASNCLNPYNWIKEIMSTTSPLSELNANHLLKKIISSKVSKYFLHFFTENKIQQIK